MPTHFLDLGLPPQGSAGAEFRAFRSAPGGVASWSSGTSQSPQKDAKYDVARLIVGCTAVIAASRRVTLA